LGNWAPQDGQLDYRLQRALRKDEVTTAAFPNGHHMGRRVVWGCPGFSRGVVHAWPSNRLLLFFARRPIGRGGRLVSRRGDLRETGFKHNTKCDEQENRGQSDADHRGRSHHVSPSRQPRGQSA
jgi:hypothetical protein